MYRLQSSSNNSGKTIYRPYVGIPFAEIVTTSPQSDNSLMVINNTGYEYSGSLYGSYPQQGERAMFIPYKGIPVAQNIFIVRQ